MRILIPAALAASMFATNLYAADAVAPLAPGKAAGVKHADAVDSSLLWIAAGIAVITIVAVITTQGSGNTAAATGTATA